MVEAWENELFDRYNGETKSPLEWEADLYDTLEPAKQNINEDENMEE